MSGLLKAGYKRQLVFVLALSFFVALGGFSDLGIVIAGMLEKPPSISLSVPTGATFELPQTEYSWRFALKGLAALLLGYWVCTKLLDVVERHIDHFQDQQSQTDRQQKIDELLWRLDMKSGIRTIYPDGHDLAISQRYAGDILKCTRTSRRLRLLSIAAYEFIGKGWESLLLESISRRAEMEVEVVILDPVQGRSVLLERAKQLYARDPKYSVEELEREIRATAAEIKKLEKSRKAHAGPVSVSFTPEHPVFRILIFDDCLFLSTYEPDCHGHESPVYKIDRVKEGQDSRMSLYRSFELYYENVKARTIPA